MPTATQNSTQRRILHFESIDQILADLEVLAAAEKEGKLRTLGIDVIPFDEALSKFRTNLNRLKAKPPEIPHSLFGPFTHEEWIAQHLRHAELHLSFLRAD